MANPQIKLKRSSTQNKRPIPDNVPLGELALNTYDGYLYASKDVGAGTTIITVNPWRVGTGTDSYNINFTAGNVGINSASPTALLDVNGDVNISGVITATSFVKSDGTSSQFLKADGSVDSSTYLTSYTETQTLNDVLGLGNISGIGLSVGVVTATSFDGNLTGFDELTAPHSSTTKNYSVTVSSKSDHRYQGTGSGSAYYIDGVESPILHLTPGRTYRFTLSSEDMSSHPFRFYLEADKTTSYTTNVTSTATYTEIVVTDETPAVIHYQCSAHGYMGNAVITHSNKVNTPYLITGLNGANITGVVTATSFSGDGSSLTGVAVGAATTITLADESSDTICYPIFATDATGDRELKTDASNLLYNSNTGALTAGSFFGDGSTLTDVLSNVSEDTTPQLGGPLDINSNNITGTGNIDITGSLDVSGIASVGSAITMYGSTGIVSATEYYGDGSNLSSIVTQLTAGTGISINQTTGNITVTATGGGGQDPTTRTTTRFVATASQSSFTVSYSVGYVDVFLNGSKLDSTEYTATNGTSVSLTTAAAADDIVEIVAYESVGITSISSATQGLDVTGHLETDTLNVSGISTLGVTTVTDLTGQQLNVSGVSTFSNSILIGTGATVGFGTTAYFKDNAKAIFGDGEDLQIYHNGSHSYIDDSGTGNLFLRSGTLSVQNLAGSKTSAVFNSGSSQEFYYDNSKKLETTTDGVSVSGIITATEGIDAIGIQSGGVNIATGIITALNFIGTGNTFAVNGTVVDISISGGGGGGGGSVGVSSDGTEITSDTSSLNFVGTGLTITDDGTTTNIYFPTTSRTTTEYTATAGQTTFSGLTYTGGLVDVYLNGSKLDSTDFTANNGTSVVLTTGASVDDRVVIVSHNNSHTVSNNAITKDVTKVTATGGQTVFSGAYTVGFVDVFLNGSKLDSSEFTANNGSSITLTTGATANDIIEIVGFRFTNGSTNIELSEDGSPELGGNLDIKGFNIIDSVGGGSITATVSGVPDALEIMLFT